MATPTNTTGVPMPTQPISWEEFVTTFNAPQAAVPPPLPYAGMPGVAELFSPTFGRDETIMRGAENAIAGGWGQGGFGQNQTNRLLDSERKANFLAGHQILEPYLQRDFQAGQNAADRQSRMDAIAAEGAQALQRLQLSESGATARLTQQEEAEARRQVVAGQQAMQQLTIQEAGDTGRQNSQIQGQLANTLLSGAMAGKTGGGKAGEPMRYTGYGTSMPYQSGVGVGGGYNFSVDAANAERRKEELAVAAASRGGSLGLGSTSIDQLLKKYGLI